MYILIFFAVFSVIFGSCDAMDALFPSAGSYKVNILVNDNPLDECSFVMSEDVIRPYFEESVSEDKDITSLIVYLKDIDGELIGNRYIYNLGYDDTLLDEDIVFSVKNLDEDLPSFSMPDDLEIGKYIFVSQVMSGKNVLQRTEKPVFYLSSNYFSYEGINVYLPGITDSLNLIPKEAVILLEADIDFESSFDPYIIWYEGRRKISEGKYSEGAGHQFWKAPDQSGFFSLRAEVFPIEHIDGLIGYQKSISLLVSSMAMDINLISNDIPQLIHWYTFEGNLIDSKMSGSAAASEHILTLTPGNTPEWMGANGTYGLSSGNNYYVSLPKVTLTDNTMENWQALFRFKHVNDGEFLSVQFGASNNAGLQLSIHEQNLILTLTTIHETVSQVLVLSDIIDDFDLDTFITAGINFSFISGVLSANINIIGNYIDGELAMMPITLDAEINDEFQIFLGFFEEDSITQEELPARGVTIWDEFALYYMPPMEILIAEVSPAVNDDDDDSLDF